MSTNAVDAKKYFGTRFKTFKLFYKPGMNSLDWVLMSTNSLDTQTFVTSFKLIYRRKMRSFNLVLMSTRSLDTDTFALSLKAQA